MNLNPKKISWNAPTQDEAGNPITLELAYTLGTQGFVGDVTPLASFPGSLNPDGRYEAVLADLVDTTPGQTYEFVMASFYTENPELQSAWSDPPVNATFVAAPNSPTGLQVA